MPIFSHSIFALLVPESRIFEAPGVHFDSVTKKSLLKTFANSPSTKKMRVYITNFKRRLLKSNCVGR